MTKIEKTANFFVFGLVYGLVRIRNIVATVVISIYMEVVGDDVS